MRFDHTGSYLFASLFFHSLILLILIIGIEFSSPLFVVENTNQHDVISAVVLGDTPKSKMIIQQPRMQQPIVDKKQQQKAILDKIQKQMQEDILALKMQQKKKQKAWQSQLQKSLRASAEQSLSQLNEEIKLTSTEAHQSQGVINKYKALILQAISEQWIVPIGANKKLYCELMIRLAAGGAVLDVQVIKSSGDTSLDSSARAAVLKASPLPVPKDSKAFSAFRQFVLKVKPENVITNNTSIF